MAELIAVLGANGPETVGIKNPIPVATPGAVVQAIPDFATAGDLLSAYGNFSQVAPGDFVTRVLTSNGQTITALSGGPLQSGESRIDLDVEVSAPCSMELEADMIRNRQQFGTISLYSNGSSGIPAPVATPIDIVSISQSTAVDGAAYTAAAGTICTVILSTPLPGEGAEDRVYLSDWINITGLVDTRLNYQNAAINFIGPDRKTICFGFSDEAALPSLAIATVTPMLGTAQVNFYNNAAGAEHGAGFRFTGTTATAAAVWSMFGGGDAQISGTLLGDHRVTNVGSTDRVVVNGKMGEYEIAASSRYRIDVTPDEVAFYTKARDNGASAWTNQAVRSAVKPGTTEKLKARFRLYQPLGMTRPTDKILAISKTGTTTATITHTGQTTYAVGNVTAIYGVKDQTNFPGSGSVVTAVLSPTQFQCVVGSAVTAASYGGSVHIVNGGAAQPGVIGQYGSTVANYSLNPEWLAFICNTTITGLSIGDYINLYGVRGSAGEDLLVDGVWEVATLNTSTVILKPVTDIFGQRVSPATPTLSGTVNCGGTIILRTTLRAHDMMLKQKLGEAEFRIVGQGTQRADLAMPTYNMGGTVTATQGPAAAPSSTTGLGPWYVMPAIVGLPDVASAAITTTTTSAAIANNLGNGFQVTFPVTAMTGTNPTLDIRIEESYDGGTNWLTLYEMQRITAIGSYNTPILRASGRHIRYVRTLGGTSPSFTMAITRNILPFIQAEPQKRLMDRSIVLTTLNSVTPTLFSGAANNVQLVINIGAATTPPALQIEGSEDGVNWYAIGTPLTAVASSTVEVTVAKSATMARARVSTAGVGVTAGYVSLKAWS